MQSPPPRSPTHTRSRVAVISPPRPAAWLGLILAACLMVFHMVQHGRMHGHQELVKQQVHLQQGPPQQPTTSSTPPFQWKKLAFTHWLGEAREPYYFPKIILQTVANKHAISCEVLKNINSWTTLNPDYKHMLFDDADIRTFMEQFHPQHLGTFLNLNSSVERTDMWRYLALHTYGGVYADSDVRCMRPIQEWNAEHHHDAKVLIGLEGVKESWHRGSQFQQWCIAAMPNHPLLLSMADYIRSFKLKDSLYSFTDIVLHRTGPARWTDAILDYMHQRGGGVPGPGSLTAGVKVADIRILPINLFALGWGETCEQAAHDHNETYICHRFYGSWKDTYDHPPASTAGCQVPEALLKPLQL